MPTVEQVRTGLETVQMLNVHRARTEHAAAQEAFASNPTPANTKALTQAANTLQAAETEHDSQAAALRSQREQEFATWQATDVERQRAIAALVSELACIERQVFERIAKIRELTQARQGDYHAGKSLSLALDRAEIVKPPTAIQTIAGDVARAIRDSRKSDGRSNAETVGEWMQPAAPAYHFRTPTEPSPR